MQIHLDLSQSELAYFRIELGESSFRLDLVGIYEWDDWNTSNCDSEDASKEVLFV